MCIAHSTFTLGPLQQPCPSFFEYQYKTPDFMANIVCSASFNRLLFVFSGISLYWSTARIERAVTTYITTRLLYHSHCECCRVPLVIAQIQFSTDLFTI